MQEAPVPGPGSTSFTRVQYRDLVSWNSEVVLQAQPPLMATPHVLWLDRLVEVDMAGWREAAVKQYARWASK